jgi:hypothetical protein
MKPSVVISIIAAVVLVAVAGVVGLVVLGIKGVSSRPPTQAEKELLVSASRLEEFGMKAPNPEMCESYLAKRNVDGSLGLEYEYDSAKNPDRTKVLYVTSQVEANRSPKDARESFTMSIAAYKAGMFMGSDLRVDPSPVKLALGDQDYWAVIKRGDKPLGNIVVVRKDTIVHSFIVIGLYFAKSEDLRSLLQPTMEKAGKAKLK